MTLSLISNTPAKNAKLPRRVRDNFLSGLPQPANDVVGNVFSWSLDHPFSFEKQAAPANGDAIVNLAGKDNGDFLVSTNYNSLAPTWYPAEKSLGFDNVKWTAGPRTPAGWMEAQFEAAALQHYLIGGYFLMPTAAQWPATQATIHSIMGDQNGSSNPRLASFRITRNNDAAPGSRAFSAAFGRSGTAPEGITINEPVQFMGKWCFVGIYRNAAERGLYIEALDATVDPVLRTLPVGAKNTDDLAASRVIWGLDNAQALGAGTYFHRAHRGFVENLEATGRAADVISVMKADAARIRARGVIA